jgi:hypothetical protein
MSTYNYFTKKIGIFVSGLLCKKLFLFIAIPGWVPAFAGMTKISCPASASQFQPDHFPAKKQRRNDRVAQTVDSPLLQNQDGFPPSRE